MLKVAKRTEVGTIFGCMQGDRLKFHAGLSYAFCRRALVASGFESTCCHVEWQSLQNGEQEEGFDTSLDDISAQCVVGI